MNALGLAELADRTWMEPGGWSVMVVPEPQIEATTEALREELTFLLEEEGVGSVRVFSERRFDTSLVEELASLRPDDIALLPLPEDRITSVSRSLDYGRTRLIGRARGVILTSEAGLRVLAAEAPNFWSWVGPRVWSLDPLAGKLNPETRLPDRAPVRLGHALNRALAVAVDKRRRDGDLLLPGQDRHVGPCLSPEVGLRCACDGVGQAHRPAFRSPTAGPYPTTRRFR